ncbi:MAG: hypothetical protein ACH350_01730 [Parachlamydiaceae bacterium]
MSIKKEEIKNEMKNSTSNKTSSCTNTSGGTNCCPSPSIAPNQLSSSPDLHPNKGSCSKQNHNPSTDKKSTAPKTRLTIKYDAGFPNQLYIRGKGANLSWDKGHLLKNIKSDEWMWETDDHFTNCEFKILINDELYETGENHHLTSGHSLLVNPCFH